MVCDWNLTTYGQRDAYMGWFQIDHRGSDRKKALELYRELARGGDDVSLFYKMVKIHVPKQTFETAPFSSVFTERKR